MVHYTAPHLSCLHNMTFFFFKAYDPVVAYSPSGEVFPGLGYWLLFHMNHAAALSSPSE